MRFLYWASLLACVTLACLSFSGHSAEACAGFSFPRQPAETEAQMAARLPFLTVEQVLLIWDKDTQTEDFIRETRFDKANQAFGFVIPTPTKPEEIAAVKKAPFDALRKAYQFEVPPPPRAAANARGLSGLGGGTKGEGAGGAEPLPPPVIVLSEQRIGSFTAFVIESTDGAAFDKWLTENGFSSTNESRPWIAHYIKQKFYFVALRYEPTKTPNGKAADAGPSAAAGVTPTMTSETVRIRFKTPHPYYPYMEPALAKDAISPYERMLTGWMVTRDRMSAVAHRPPLPYPYTENRFQRPWADGISYSVTSDDLAKVVGAELRPILPKTEATATDGGDNSRGTLIVQSFRDRKTRRDGWGDVVLVPQRALDIHGSADSPPPFTAAEKAEREFLVAVLDPGLLHPDEDEYATWPDAGGPSPASASDASTSTSTTTADGGTPTKSTRPSCAFASSSSSPSSAGWAAAVVLGAVALQRRRRRRVLACVGALLLVACRPKGNAAQDAATTLDSTDAGQQSEHSEYPKTPAERQVEIMTMAGSPPPTREERIALVYALLEGKHAAAIWRDGDQNRVNLPKGDARIGAGSVTGGVLDGNYRVLAGFRPRFRQCFQTGLNSDPRMSGKLTIRAEIQPDGTVSKSEVASNAGLTPAVAECCARVVLRGQFDEPKTKVVLTVPVEFTARIE